jgi:hypothetical protein
MTIDTASLDEAARGPKKTGFLMSIGGPQFITAQLFTIFATILGVYLAGYVGFQRTLQYDRFVKAEQQANLLTAMHAELKENTERLRAFVPALEKTQEGQGVYGDWPRLYLFIWKASAENPTVFATPPQTLADMQTFYEDIGKMLNEERMQEAFRRITSSNAYERKTFTEQFDAQIKIAETKLLPALQNAAATAQSLITEYADPK